MRGPTVPLEVTAVTLLRTGKKSCYGERKRSKSSYSIVRDGCGSTGNAQSYGDALNAAGGGVYATYLQDNRLRIWSWPKASVPADLSSGSPNPETWGTASSDFKTSNGGCSIADNFQSQTIIINTDFCGSMIDDGTWNAVTSCSNVESTCRAFAAGHPDAFADAYWLFNSIKLYESTGTDDKVSQDGNCGGTTAQTCLRVHLWGLL